MPVPNVKRETRSINGWQMPAGVSFRILAGKHRLMSAVKYHPQVISSAATPGGPPIPNGIGNGPKSLIRSAQRFLLAPLVEMTTHNFLTKINVFPNADVR